MPFTISKSASLASESPEALLWDLRTRKIPGLLSHQADILRDYMETALDRPDVAFQLPTGSGKTLVGLLLGEWRRQKYGERIVYLCPTKQLVNQVAEQANSKYGMRVIPFTGPKVEYDTAAKNDYLNGDAIAITPYSALFNVRPFFENPNIIILDDAHAAESYISSQWSLRIDRSDEEHKNLFIALAGVISKVISHTDQQRLSGDEEFLWEKGWVDKLPTPLFFPLIPEIANLLDTYVRETNLAYPWMLLRDHIQACNFYYSSQEILIRPLIPPTSTHAPFAAVKQRVYMSATLGEGGDLERITGRREIYRLQVPLGWDKQGIGRRLFILPERSLSEDEQDQLTFEMMGKTGRSLVLCPDDRNAKRLRELITQRIGFPTFQASEIEFSKQPFISKDQAVAVIAGRYDGIDFPDEECRLMIVHGLPRATNLQERFIISRMGAVALLNDRILTRVVQAFGRCTRAATDYAAVVIRGEELNKFIMTRERRTFLHPELQAELEFGIEQSKERTLADFLENLDLFLNQGKEWAEADASLIALRQGFTQKKLPGSDNLRAAVSHEIEYQSALWRGDFIMALEEARSVLAELKDTELIGYRALWNYLAGSAAWLAANAGMASLKPLAKTYFNAALAATGSIGWLVGLARNQLADVPAPSSDESVLTTILIERLESVLEKLGTLHNQKYDVEEKAIMDGLSTNNSSQFEDAHRRLGTLLGFESGNSEGAALRDPLWIVDDTTCLIFEDHSDAGENAIIHIAKARQVLSHPELVPVNLGVAEGTVITPILISSALSADQEALPHLRDVYFWHIEDFRRWAL